MAFAAFTGSASFCFHQITWSAHLEAETTKAIRVNPLSFHFLKGNSDFRYQTRVFLAGTFKVAFMSACLCAAVPGWTTAGTVGWQRLKPGSMEAVLGSSSCRHFLHRAGRMQAGCLGPSAENRQKSLCFTYSSSFGVLRWTWQADVMAWLNMTTLITYLGSLRHLQ